MTALLTDKTLETVERSMAYLITDLIFNFIGGIGTLLVASYAVWTWWNGSGGSVKFWIEIILLGVALIGVRYAKDELFARAGIAPPDYLEWFGPEQIQTGIDSNMRLILDKQSRGTRIIARGIRVEELLQQNLAHHFTPRSATEIGQNIKLMNGIRWILVLPSAIGTYVGLTILILVIHPSLADSDAWIQFLAGFVCPCAAILIAINVAPSHRFSIGIVLTAASALFSIYMGIWLISTRSVVAWDRFWTIVWRLCGIAAAVYICYSLREDTEARS